LLHILVLYLHQAQKIYLHKMHNGHDPTRFCKGNNPVRLTLHLLSTFLDYAFANRLNLGYTYSILYHKQVSLSDLYKTKDHTHHYAGFNHFIVVS